MRVLLMFLMVVAWAASADVYKTVDKDGHVIYSDSPTTDKAQKVELREINTVPPAELMPNSTSMESSGVREEKITYSIEIVSPRADVTIPPGQRDLAIAVSMDRPLRGDHLLVYFMNGELLEETTMTSIVVKDVPRGSHTLVVEAIDESGQSLGTSAPVIVNVIRPTIKPAASPKPKAK